jgi:hypothetical protein
MHQSYLATNPLEMAFGCNQIPSYLNPWVPGPTLREQAGNKPRAGRNAVCLISR